jgi:hypothetical protein
MLKTIGATLAIAFVAGQALALNPQPLPPKLAPHVSHIVPRCPPTKGLGKTCV